MGSSTSLAPAAGAGVGKLLADLLLADPGFLPAMKEAAMRGLTAMQPRRWDKENECWGEAVPDARVQVQTVAMLLAHMEGEPIKRIVHQHLGADGGPDPVAAMRESPALRAAVERTLANAQFKNRNNPKPVPVAVAETIELEG